MMHGICHAEFQLDETALFAMSLLSRRNLVNSSRYSAFACPVCQLRCDQGDCRGTISHNSQRPSYESERLPRIHHAYRLL
jgi:hypothetical protein